MRKTLRVPILFLGLFLLLTSACQNKLEIGEVQKLKVFGLDNGKLKCQIEMEISNFSIFAYNVETGELHALADDKDFGVVKLSNPLRIAGHTSKAYTIDFTIEINNAEAGLFSVMNSFMGKKTDYRLKGSVVARSFFIRRTISLDKLITQ